jgi:BASS family bile acid:Na+ symporter
MAQSTADGDGSELAVLSILSSLLRLLGNRNLLFIAAIVLGIAAGHLSHWTRPWTLPALALAMTVSTTQVASDAFWPLRRLLRPMLLAVGLNYVLLNAVILLPARALVRDADLWAGFVLTAAAPPGVGIIPFSYILGGDTALAVVGTVGAYLAALLILPAMVLLLAGKSLVQPVSLVLTLVQLIVVPLLLSRLLRASPARAALERWRGKIVNWAFALVLFTIIGTNRDVFLRELGVVAVVSAITAARSFGLALALEKVLARVGLDRSTRVSYVLMATLKNGGFAAGTALALFGERASIPAGVGAAVAVPYLLWLGLRWEKE